MTFEKYIAVVLTACSLASATHAFGQADEETKLVRKGNTSYKDKKYEEAGKSYSAALAVRPNSFRALYNLGAAYYKQQQYTEAAAQFEKLATEKTSKDTLSKVYHNLGNSLLKMSITIDSSLAGIQKRIVDMEDDPNKEMSERVDEYVKRDSLQQVHQQLSDREDSLLVKSMDAYKRSLRNNPADEDTRYNLAYAQKMVKKNDERKNKNNPDKDKKQPSAFALSLKKKADGLVALRKYEQAYLILSDGMKKDATVNNYSDYMQKIKDVIDINKLK